MWNAVSASRVECHFPSAGVWVLVLGMVTYDQSDVTHSLSGVMETPFTRLGDSAESQRSGGKRQCYDRWWVRYMLKSGDRCNLTRTAPSFAKLSWPSQLPTLSEWVVTGMRHCCNWLPSDLWITKRLFDAFWLMCSGASLMLPNISFFPLSSVAN